MKPSPSKPVSVAQGAAAAAAPRKRIHELGSVLRSALAAVLVPLGGGSLRPAGLARSLKIDDTLAARLLRSVRASDGLYALREMPAPSGLRLFLEAAGRAGVGESVRAPAEAAVKQLEQLLGELPLGRASLDTAIDGWLPSGRARAERAARQSVYKAMSQTLGYTVDTACFAHAIQPSAAGDTCDSLTFVAMDGIRRLREGAPILLFAHQWEHGVCEPGARGGLPAPYTETLDGQREVMDARKLLLPEVGDGARLPMRMIDRGSHTRVVLESTTPPINVPVSAAVAYLTRNAYRRYRSGEDATEVFLNCCKVPISAFIQDLFIHEDVYPAFVPDIVPRMDNLSFNPGVRDEEMLEVDRLDLDIQLDRLGWGLGRIGVKEWGGYEPALRTAFARAGWEADRFRAYRCYVRYPFPFVSMTTWFDLPPAPV